MKTYYYLIGLCTLIVSLNACKKEDTPVASPSNEFYTLPQGNAAYDDLFVQFQKDYNSYILYRFSENDFRWNGTSRLPYMAKEGEPAAIMDAFTFIQKAFLSDYSKDRLQQLMPYKILLSAGIYQLTVNTAKPTGYDTLTTNIGLYSGINHVTFGYVNSTLKTLNSSKKKDIQADLHRTFFTQALGRQKISIPSSFTALFNATGNSATAYKGLGFLEYQRSYTVDMDFLAFIYYALRYNEIQFKASYLTTAFDTSGLIAKKYALVKKYLKDNWEIDTEIISNRDL